MHPSLSHLENIDARFLEPNVSLVVMPEDTECALDDANLALEGLSSMLDSMAGMNIALRKSGQCTKFVEMPPDCLSALLRMVSDKIKPCTNNPSLRTIQKVRPDLFPHQGV